MSKAYLIMDMPKSCDECPMFGNHYSDLCCKGLNNRSINYPYPNDKKQSWCPLRELPQKKEATQQPLSPLLQTQYTDYEAGYNACIDEIMRGSEENDRI